MGSSAGAFDQFVEKLDYPLYVVTASDGDHRAGCLAGFVTQSSIHPAQFLVCISRINYTFGIAEHSMALGVHLLGSDQAGTASLFGEASGDDVNKFDEVDWNVGVTGVPLLRDCAGWIEGPVVGRMSGGDHEVFLVSVAGSGVGSRPGRFMLSDAAGFEPGHPES
jgi:flavin reductase (DIM6/NTAB) family NADH-FMN oxidoreductase RutF